MACIARIPGGASPYPVARRAERRGFSFRPPLRASNFNATSSIGLKLASRKRGLVNRFARSAGIGSGARFVGLLDALFIAVAFCAFRFVGPVLRARIGGRG